MRAHELIAESLANQTLYHGGEQPVTRFKIPPHGVYFSPHADWAANYGDVITQAQVNADRVYQIDYSHDIDDEIVDALFDRDYSQVAKFVRLLQAQGYQAMQSVTDSEMVVVFPGTHIEVLGNNSIDINESHGPGRHAIPLPIGDYLSWEPPEFVAESLDRAYEWESQPDGGIFRAADGEIVRVRFDRLGLARYDVWALGFSRGVTYDLTGTGDEFRVFATVAAIIRDWVQRVQPSALTFSADKSDGNRARLYQRLINRLSRNSGYVDVSRNAGVITDSGVSFVIQTILYKLNTSSHLVFALARQDLVADQEFVNENWGVEKFAIPLPIGDYLASGSDEFAPPGNYQSAEDLHDEVYDLIDAGVEPDVVTVDPRTVLATQDWLSNAGGDDPLFDEYPDRPVVYQKAGRLYILDGHHRTTRAWKTGKPITVYLFGDNNLTEDVYSVLNSYQCGPFDGGCVLVAQALQKIHGGNIVVLVDQSDQAQHAAVAVDGQLMDYSGAAEPMQFIRKFEEDEHVNIAGVRPFKPGDLPEAPSNDNQVIDQLVRALSENFASRHRYKLRDLI
jgi:hypothetical protein